MVRAQTCLHTSMPSWDQRYWIKDKTKRNADWAAEYFIFTYLIALAIPAEGEFFGLFEIYRVKTLQVLAVPSALHFVLSFCTLLSNGNFFSQRSLLASLHEIATSRVSFWPGLALFFVHVNFLSWMPWQLGEMQGGSTLGINICHLVNIGT